MLKTMNLVKPNIRYRYHQQCTEILFHVSASVLQLFKAMQIHMGFRQMEENLQSCWDVWHAFLLGGAIHAHRKPHVAPHVSPHVVPQEVPNSLYTKCTQSQQDAKILYNKAWFCTCGPILKVMRILLITGWGRLTDSIYPTIHTFRTPHYTIYARVSSARVPWREGQRPTPSCCSSGTSCSSKQQIRLPLGTAASWFPSK